MESLHSFIDLFEKNSILIEQNCEENVQVENISRQSLVVVLFPIQYHQPLGQIVLSEKAIRIYHLES